MKRDSWNVSGSVGLRRRTDYPEFVEARAEAEGTIAGLDVETFRRQIDDPFGVHQSDAELLADFADFMQGDLAFDDGPLPSPEPGQRSECWSARGPRPGPGLRRCAPQWRRPASRCSVTSSWPSPTR